MINMPTGWVVLVTVLAIIGLAIFAAIAVRIDDWKRDWTTNWAETDQSSKVAELRPLHSPLPPDALKQQVHEWIALQPHWQLADESTEMGAAAPPDGSADPLPLRLHAVRTTGIMRFKDDVHITIDADPKTTGSLLRAKSRSRIGRGDLGQNPRNIKELIAAMKARQ